ncbi:MAG: hypothetical protein ACF8XB_19450 [Planctomycetota bacterium JB042]
MPSALRLLVSTLLLGALLPAVRAQSSAPLLAATVRVEGGGETRFEYGTTGSTGLRAFALDTEGRPGVAAVVGGHGRTGPIGGKSGLTFLFFLHFHDDRSVFLEAQLLNDAIDDPPGKVAAAWEVSLQGREVAKGNGRFADETGVTIFAGTTRAAPRADLVAELLSTMPAPGTIRGAPPPGPKADDPDPVRNTHQTGSPRNAWVAVDAARFLSTGEAGHLERLLDFVAAQARRPYHLSEANGEPFLFERHPTAAFIEGKPELRSHRATFGRMQLPPAAFDAGGFNGWDHEHMNVEELYAAYVLLGSRVARRELVLIAEQLLSTRYVKDEGQHQHSARAFGWVARLLVRAAQATGEPRYRAGVRRMMGSLKAHWQPNGAYKALVAQEPRGDHMPDQRWESPFHVAVATSALALHLRVFPDDAEARELLRFCGDLLVDQGYSPRNGGFFYDYSVESSAKNGDGKQTKGVALWICAPLVEVAWAVPEGERAKYLAPARRLWDANRVEDWGKPSHDIYWRWFLPAAKEFGP